MINYCPATLAEGFKTYSPSALRNIFFGKKVSHILDFEAPQISEEISHIFRQNSRSISISGAQFKQSLVLDKNKLRFTNENERGHYILKPIPFRSSFRLAEDLPANEHLTMQIARQIYKINTAQSALVFFKSGKPAYLTKRFDFTKEGNKIPQEDFATLSQKSKQKDGESYKYEGNYELLAQILKKYTVAFLPELEKFYEIVLFNYLFSNGDAHLKNFSLQATPQGDYILSPAYDLLNTRLHLPNDSFLALKDGLFDQDYYTESFEVLGFYAYDDFYEFGLKIGIKEKRLLKILEKFYSRNPLIIDYIERSFLSQKGKEIYKTYYLERLEMLNNSYKLRKSV